MYPYRKKKRIENDIKQGNPNISASELKQRIKQTEKLTIEFHNTSDWTIKKIYDEDATKHEDNFRDYLKHFSPKVNEIIDKFDFRQTIGKLVENNRLDSILEMFSEQDFSNSVLSNLEMGYVYEELLRRFTQENAKTAGDHFTPREIIRIMVELMEIDFDPKKAKKAFSIYDPACGTGGMLSVTKEHLLDKAKSDDQIKNVNELVLLFGQEYQPFTYAVSKTEMLIKGDTDADITHGNSLIQNITGNKEPGDFHFDKTFDYMISNPPFGVDWSEYKKDAEKLKASRYKWGMTPVNDGALLFLLTMIVK
jgi:type I restriction enzyme M protein